MNYSDLKISRDSRSMDEICNVEKMQYQKHQLFCRRWFENNNRKMLLFHGLGSGKTLTSIYVAEGLLENNKIEKVYAITPASLRKNFEKELSSGLMKNTYKHTPHKYNIMSYQKFVKLFENDGLDLKNALVIIDEVQNIVSDSGSMYKKFFHALVTKSPNNMRLLLLSGTPMFDKPHEIAMTLNLLGLPKLFNVNTFYKDYLKNGNIVNEESFMEKVYPFVSGFKGISPKAYATRKDITVNCLMRASQRIGYDMTVNEANNTGLSKAFLSGPRMAANAIYGNGGIGKTFVKGARRKDVFSPKFIKNFSAKFHQCIKRLKKTKKQAFIYSNFVESGGVNDLVIAMKLHGIKSSRFGIFQTNQDEKNKLLIQRFNDGKFQFIIGSPAMKEGISLKNCREVHLLDPYWNLSRVNQVIGRAIRFCSHASLPKYERRVNVYHYIAKIQDLKTVDEHIVDISKQKANVINKFEQLLYRASADCNLFYNSTGLNSLDCFKRDSSNNVTKLKGFFNIIYKNSKYVSSDIKKEKRLLETLQAQGIVSKEQIIFNTHLYGKQNARFGFIHKELNKYIGKTKYHKSEKEYIKLKLKVPRKIKSSGTKINKKSKGLVFASVPKVSYIKVKGPKAKKDVKCSHEQDTDGNCSDIKFPFKREKCCFSRPGKKSTGIVIGGDKVYADGKYTKTMTLAQLTKTALMYNKLLMPKMKRRNIINSLRR